MMLRLENTLGQKLELYPTDDEELSLLQEQVDETGRQAASQLCDEQVKSKSSSSRKRRSVVEETDDKDRLDDDVVEAGMPKYSLKRKRGA